MKKSLLLLSLLISPLLSAQQQVVITQTDGTRLVYPVWKIQDITFEDIELPKITPPEAGVDLGLKSGLLWAPWNIGAESEEEIGFLLGWGNPDSTNLSSDLKHFPRPTVERSITNTDNDVAKTYWGGLWHMPTIEDFEELLTLDWKWMPEKNAYKVTNPDAPEDLKDNCIYFPATGMRLGEAEPYYNDFGFYWSGAIAENKDSAVYMRFPVISEPGAEVDMSLWQLLGGLRSKHFAVRPVYGKYKVPATIEAGVADVSQNSATIPLTISGQADSLRYYILLGMEENPNERNASQSTTYIIREPIDGTISESITLDGLDYGTTYYYRAVVIVDNDSIYEDSYQEFTTPIDDRIVDLGLTKNWAKWNIGAQAEGDYGWLVTWGASEHYGTPYSGSGDISYSENDIAHNEWGGQWCMPSEEDFMELIENCTAEYKVDDATGHAGILFSRLGKSVFIPFAGYSNESSRKNSGVGAYLWTNYASVFQAHGLVMTSPLLPPFYQATSQYSDQHFSVRAVCPAGRDEIIPDGQTDPQDPDDPQEQQSNLPESTPKGVKAVDLGLTSGTLWSNMNLGATDSLSAGGYYSWGELSSDKNNNYLITNYSYYANDQYIRFEAATGGPLYFAGDANYDAATSAWGENSSCRWEVPTKVQIQELIDECDWTWNVSNNVSGYFVKSKKNNNKIFIPASSFYAGRGKSSGAIGYYWSSTLVPYNNESFERAYCLKFEEGSQKTSEHVRADGLTIRPILTLK